MDPVLVFAAFRRLGVVSALMGVTAALLVACAPLPTHENPLGALAGEKTTAAGSFHMTGDLKMVDTSNPSHVDSDTTQQGVVDLVHQRSEMTVTSPTTGAGPEKVTVGGNSWEYIPFPSDVINPKPWIPINEEPEGMNPAFGNVDPVGLLGELKERGDQLRLIGSELVRGVHTAHYRVSTPLPTGTVTFFVFGPFQFDVWIDNNGLVRRLRQTVDLGPQSSGQDESVVATFDLFDFGTQDSIQPPPADQVQGPAPVNPSPPPTTVPTVPRPTVTAPSALQLRTVELIRNAPCSASSPPANPAAGKPATLRGPDGNCYDLDVAALTITQARASPEAEFDNQLGVRVALDPSDAARLSQLALTDYQLPVAIVMFGRVLSAPTFASQQLSGEVIISPIDPETAANVIAALSS